MRDETDKPEPEQAKRHFGSRADPPTAAEVREKMNAAERSAATSFQAGHSQGAAGRAYENQCGRPSLRDRVDGARHRAERASEECGPLQELARMLDQYPAIARILELIEQTGV